MGTQNDDIIILHLGAGKHSLRYSSKYRKLIKRAIIGSLTHTDPLSRLTCITDELEENELTNTGRGSSLNLLGKVECDASFLILDHDSNKKQLGSMYNIVSISPIKRTLHYHLSKDDDTLGLTKPLIVDYKSVYNNESCQTELITEKSSNIYKCYHNEIKNHYNNTHINENIRTQLTEYIPDTIGVILSTPSTTYLATSSGGNFFKLPGRIGCASVVGAAIYSNSNSHHGVSVTCSGNGEDIMMMDMSRYITNRVLNELKNCIDEDINFTDKLVEYINEKVNEFDMRAVDASGERVVYLGMIVLIRKRNSNENHLIYCHSTESFYFGYKNFDNDIEYVLSQNEKVGTFLVGEFML